ncbi:MAG: response regulator [Opitutaceae bacterium]|jgi:PAS domain S-box-containing protein
MSAPPSAAPVVIIVNDDELQLSLLSEILAGEPWQVVSCLSVAAALDAIEKQRPALIITDLYMPEVDGWMFCRMLRSSSYPRLNRTPVIVVSATFAGEDASQIATELGANDFFPFPMDGPALRARVRSLIENPAAPVAWTVLLAGANAELADINAVFGAHGCHVKPVDSTAAATAELAGAPWETVICDLDLPGCTLDHLSEWTRAHPRSAFVVVTSDLDPASAVASLRAGASAHLRRPFAPGYLFGLCELARQKNSLLRAQRLLERRTIELRNSQRLLQSILDSSDQAYLVINPAGMLDMANAAARKITSELFSGDLHEGASVLPLLPDAMRIRAQESIALAMAGRVVQHDATVADRSGRHREFIVRYTPLRGYDSKIDRVCFNALDITARKEVEDALRLRNRALSSISQGVLIADSSRRITYANESYEAITGYSSHEIIGRICGFTQGKDSDQSTRHLIREALAADEPFHGEILNYRKNGEAFWNDLSITPVKDPYGSVTQYLGVMKDVTARKLQENELRASQTRLQALFDHSHDAILMSDDTGRYVDVNPAACRLLGYTRDELLHLGIVELVSTGDRSWAEGSWMEFLANGGQTGECTLHRKDGSMLRADFSAVAGILPGLHLSILRDLSERNALQAQLLRQQRLESVGRLASGVAHDLNNILTPILMAPTMLRSHVSDAGARMLLETLENSARRGSAIVHQLLAFSRGDPGDKVRLDLRAVVHDAGAIIRDTFPKHIALDATLQTGEFPVLGDAQQLKQVVLNLALNAADSMPRGGRLVLALGRVDISPADALRDPETRAGAYVMLTVADHGTGIAPEHLDKIFDPFFTTKPFGQGSGLGLSVVRSIVLGHGGFIRVGSRMGIGTIMKVHLPARVDHPAASAPPVAIPARAAPSGAGRTVLVVDDEAGVRDIIRLTLTREGYRVMCADGADAAFSQLQSCGGKVDLVLTDIAMPGVSGAKFIELLRGRRPDLGILVMTGADADRAIPQAVRNTIRGVLTKPFEAVALVLAVNQAVQGNSV